MNWLNAIPEADRRAIVAELAQRLSDEPTLKTAWETAVERVLERHGFKQPHSATSVAHNIMADNTERDRHAARMLALSTAIVQMKQAAAFYNGEDPEGKPFLTKAGEKLGEAIRTSSTEYRHRMLLAIAAVEREFKP